MPGSKCGKQLAVKRDNNLSFKEHVESKQTKRKLKKKKKKEKSNQKINVPNTILSWMNFD